MFRAVTFAIAVALTSASAGAGEPPAGPAPELTGYKAEAALKIDNMQKFTQEVVDSVFSFAELGFQEFETQRYLTSILEENGFSVEQGVSGIPTAWWATWGSGKPVIALGSDIDGIPKSSQMPGVAWRQPMIEGAPGHGEGHNSGQAVNITAALAVKEIMQREGLPGTIVLWPGVAEELVATKAWFARDGRFNGVDAVLFTHVSDNMAVGWGRPSGTGLVSVEYTFDGLAAHGAGDPWKGRSALDAVELMNVGWNFRREHLRLHQRSHYIIANGGSQPNVVPSEASVWYYFRELDYPRIKELHELGRTMANAAAAMTSTEMSERVLGAAWPQNYSKPLAEAMHANIVAVGMPEWSDADVALAKAAQRELERDTVGLRTEVPDSLREADQGMGGGSDDIAEVSWVVPTVRLRYPANIPGMTGHHWSSGIAMATPIAHKGSNYGSRVVARTAIDLLVNETLRQETKRWFNEVQTKDYQWESLIPLDTPPPVHLNQERMAGFRDQLEPLRYDPTRYDTYLEQLGVTYPTVRQP